jgi:hypothetical protein
VDVQFPTVRRDEIPEGVFVAGSGASESGVRHPLIVASNGDGRPPTATASRAVRLRQR